MKLEIAKVAGRLADKDLTMDITPAATAFLIDKGYHPDFGARPLRRAIEHHLEDKLSEDLLRGMFDGKNHIIVEVDKEVGQLKFTPVLREADKAAV